MNYYMPTQFYLENNCIKNHQKELNQCGKKALIVTGKHSSKMNGSLDDLTESLTIPYVIFDEIEENPTLDICEKGAEIGKKEHVDFVIGLGGGSSMDAAKAIALLIKNKQEDKTCFYQKKELDYVDVICIPTTCGTGSEVTSKAVLMNPSEHKKGSISHDIWPKYAFVDGKYLAYASHELIANTAIDALCHLIESHLNTKATDLSHMISGYGLQKFKTIKDSLLTHEYNYNELMLVSSIAGMAIAQTGTTIPHALSYDLTCFYNISHGQACGIYIVSYLRVGIEQNDQDAKDVLKYLGFSDIDSFDEWIHKLIKKPKIEDHEFLKNSILKNEAKLRTSKIYIKSAEIHKIIEESLD